VREVYRGVRDGKIASHVGSVLLSCLRLELELVDRFEVAQRLAQFDADIAALEARYRELRSRMSQARVR